MSNGKDTSIHLIVGLIKKKMADKVLREESNCVVFWSSKWRLFKQKHNKTKTIQRQQ